MCIETCWILTSYINMKITLSMNVQCYIALCNNSSLNITFLLAFEPKHHFFTCFWKQSVRFQLVNIWSQILMCLPLQLEMNKRLRQAQSNRALILIIIGYDTKDQKFMMISLFSSASEPTSTWSKLWATESKDRALWSLISSILHNKVWECDKNFKHQGWNSLSVIEQIFQS